MNTIEHMSYTYTDYYQDKDGKHLTIFMSSGTFCIHEDASTWHHNYDCMHDVHCQFIHVLQLMRMTYDWDRNLENESVTNFFSGFSSKVISFFYRGRNAMFVPAYVTLTVLWKANVCIRAFLSFYTVKWFEHVTFMKSQISMKFMPTGAVLMKFSQNFTILLVHAGSTRSRIDWDCVIRSVLFRTCISR